MAVIKAPSYEERRKIIEPYLIATGELVYAWNQLHEELAGLFWRITGIKNGAIPFAIWHSTPSDHGQRAMLKAAAKVALAKNEAALKEVLWLLDRIDKSLRHKRNDAIHAPVVLVTDDKGTIIAPRDMTNNPRALALRGKEILKEITWYRETAEALRAFCWQLRMALRPGGSHPLPKRPDMPHLGTQKVPKDTHRGNTQKAPRRPHQSIQEAP
jgi:hypothetical protein